MHHFNYRRLLLLAAIFGVLSACKKNIDTASNFQPPTDTLPPPPPTVSAEVLMKDSIFDFAKDIYLWEDKIPASFDVQSYSGPDAIMKGIRPFSIEPGFSSPVDRWSFAMKKTDWDKMSAGLNWLQDNSTSQGDFGFSVFFRAEGDLRVRLVEPASPAGKAGIRRGWKITQINSSTNITTGNADFIVNNLYNSNAVTVTFLKPDGNTQTISLSAGNYAEKPVYLDTVYHTAGKRIGYLVFNSFLGNETQISAEFQRVFTKFAAQNITHIIVDLRYNGGGYVSLQEKLANWLISSSASGGVMMNQVFNEKNKTNNETTYFNKRGAINLPDVHFIVGRATASASELLINNLKPYMDVKLYGASNTHGKPVGYFPIPVGEWYIFPVSFRTTNKQGEGNYFNGFEVNKQVADGLDKDWGDVSEASLASAIRYITTGLFTTDERTSTKQITPAVINGNDILDRPFLKVTIDRQN